MRLIPSLVILCLLTSCVGPTERAVARPVPVPASPVRGPAAATPADAAAPAAPAEWNYRAATPGSWSYRTDGAGTIALFGPSAAQILLTVRCDRAARRVSLIRAGTGQGAMTVRTSFGTQLWPATTSAAGLSQTVAIRAASDPALDQIAYSRGRFAVEVQGLAPLIIPAWAEVGRVIEDCRG